MADNRRASGVYYYSEVVNPEANLGENKYSTVSFSKKKEPSLAGIQSIDFKISNSLLTQSKPTAPITVPNNAPVLQPSRSRSNSTPPPSLSLIIPNKEHTMLPVPAEAEDVINTPPGKINFTFDPKAAKAELERQRSRTQVENSEPPPPYSDHDGHAPAAAASVIPPGSPKARPARVLKRNPSFWSPKNRLSLKNQLTLRRYTDVGITTVTLNVSGTLFATTTNTLCRDPDTLFVTILEREELAIKNGKHIFLDRNPKYFGPILDYMRTGHFDREANVKMAKSIMLEAEFFKVKGLVKILNEVPEFSRLHILQIINSAEKPKLRGLWLPTINLAGMDLTRVNLDFSQLSRSNMRNVLLGGASISNACFQEVNMRNAVLNHSTMAHSDFAGANLSSVNMHFVKAFGCNFANCDLSYCSFEGADIQECDFTGANVSGANFTSTDLTKSSFRNATFSEETVFENTITKGVDYEGSNIEITRKNKGVFSKLTKNKKKS